MEPYQGEVMLMCPAKGYDFGNSALVVVSGAKGNPWGHALLNVGGQGGYYFQVAGVRTVPRYMDLNGYNRYLKENAKSEIRRVPVRIPNGDAAQRHLDQLLEKPWQWWGIVENCQSFAEEIIAAGGGRPIRDTWYAKPIAVTRQQTSGASGSW